MSLKVCVVGIGYVGMPLTYLLAQYSMSKVCAYDIDHDRIDAAALGLDHTGLIPPNVADNYHDSVTWCYAMPSDADIYIVCVPTPDKDGKPDYSYVDAACSEVIDTAKKGAVLVLESTVAPGTTRDRIGKMLAQRPDGDILAVFSPERINPGPDAYREMKQSVKLIGVDDDSHPGFDNLCMLYARTFAGLEVVNDTRVAELAKCFENFQRDMNIAMVNELAIKCYHSQINMSDVFKALRTKPAADTHSFHPGIVGGHCIPVDPHYLAEWYGDELPSLPTIGRLVNEMYAGHVIDVVLRNLKTGDRILVLGETYKPDVDDTRNSGPLLIVDTLREKGFTCHVHDPVTAKYEEASYGIPYNMVIAAVNHRDFHGQAIATCFDLAIDCTAINIGKFSRYQLNGIPNIVNL